MAHEYADLATLKEALNIREDDTTADSLLTKAMAAASRAIDRMTGRRFWLDDTATQRVIHPLWHVSHRDDGDRLFVPDIGDADGLVVEVRSGSSWSAVTDYETHPDGALADGWPITGLLAPRQTWGYGGAARVRITARWGWPAVPDDIAHAVLIQSQRLYRRKDSPEGVVGSSEWGVARLARVDPDVAALVQPYALPGIA